MNRGGCCKALINYTRDNKMQKLKLNAHEKEVIVLKAVQELIDEMVNCDVFELTSSDSGYEIQFKSPLHQKFFNIILVDFLSCPDKGILGEKRSYLSALKEICSLPNFEQNNSIDGLKNSTNVFSGWLDDKCKAKLWLPSIGKETDLSIKIVDFIKICGNISKHNFARLFHNIGKLRSIFEEDSEAINLNDDEALIVIGDFYEKFHDDIFNYHSSVIAEFLNNIWWGIYDYLLPEYKKSHVCEIEDGLDVNSYTYPAEIQNSFAKECYWELMSSIHFRSHMKKFEVTKYLKKIC